MKSKVTKWRYWIVPLFSVLTLTASGDLRLVDAAKQKNTDAVRSLLEQHVAVNTAQGDGATALHWAAHWNDLEMADLLIRAGSNVNAANDNGVTALWLACNNGSAAMVEKLLQAGADVNGPQPAGETALLRCSRTGNVEAVTSLLAHGADVNAKEKTGQTALMWALEQRHPKVVRTLIEHGADVNAVSKGGFTPLLFAAQQGDVESGELLLERGANAKVTTRDGSNPLLLAINSGREQFAIFLVQHGADPNSVDAGGISALHYSLQAGISALNGAQHDPQIAAGVDALWRPNMVELIPALLSHGANPNIRISKLVPRPIQNKPKVSLKGFTPFILAAATGDVPTMKLLLAKGADPMLTSDDGTTAIMAAAGISRAEERSKDEEERDLEALKFLVALGGDVKTANKNGLTAMHGAAYSGADEIVQFLADHGARMDVRDKFGETPLSVSMGDPNGLADDFSRRVHPSTEALIRKLTGDNIWLAPVVQRASASESGAK